MSFLGSITARRDAVTEALRQGGGHSAAEGEAAGLEEISDIPEFISTTSRTPGSSSSRACTGI
jgi:hypothetical protein